MKQERGTPPQALPRGTIKSFREYLNVKCAGGTMHKHVTASKVHYGQKVRPYGDYLYHQDRAKFDWEMAQAFGGHDHHDWVRP